MKNDEETRENEEGTLCIVRYISNEYVLNHMTTNGNVATARMLMDLRCCSYKDEDAMRMSLTRLKIRNRQLHKSKSKTAGQLKYNDLRYAEFSFPTESNLPPRFISFYNKNMTIKDNR
jgi:hypothetical protein